MATLTGNHYSQYGLQSLSGGSGVNRQASPFGRVRLVGKAGEIIRVSTAGLGTNVCQYQAILMQAFGTSVHVSLTLEDPDVALNPDNDATVWHASENIASGNIKSLAHPTATAIKVEFVSDGYAIIAFT